jgi:hypothetical protein
VKTNGTGANSMTLTFTPKDINDSGYSVALAPLTLKIVDSVTAAAQAAVNTPATIIFPSARVGTSESQIVSVTNTAAASAANLDVTLTASGNATASGSISQLAPGATNASNLSVGINTTTAGALSGSVTENFASDFGNGNTAPIASESPFIDVFGSVYRLAAASITAPGTIVHVNDPGTVTLTVANTDPADGFSENLIASLSGTTGNIGIGSAGPTGDIAAGAGDSTTLKVSFSTAQAGTVSGTATVALTSDGGIGSGSIDRLGTIALAPQNVAVNVTVNNFAVAALSEVSGGGTFTHNGNNYTLDLGTITQGSGSDHGQP